MSANAACKCLSKGPVILIHDVIILFYQITCYINHPCGRVSMGGPAPSSCMLLLHAEVAGMLHLPYEWGPLCHVNFIKCTSRLSQYVLHSQGNFKNPPYICVMLVNGQCPVYYFFLESLGFICHVDFKR